VSPCARTRSRSGAARGNGRGRPPGAAGGTAVDGRRVPVPALIGIDPAVGFAPEPHQEIVVAFGTAAQLPSPIPSTYRFPPGE